MKVTTLYGVDGVRDGWVVARAAPDLGFIELHFVDDLEALFWRVVRDDGLLVIDIPIGLPDSAPRACDREARAMLGSPRASSVFPAPVRAALEATDYDEACRLSHAASGHKLSHQTFNLLPKLREVDELIWTERQTRILEGHPEVSFTTIGGRERGMEYPKSTPQGQAERCALLEGALPSADINALLLNVPRQVKKVDDCFDALVLLLTAHRVMSGREIRLPRNRIEIDSRGLRMEIVA